MNHPAHPFPPEEYTILTDDRRLGLEIENRGSFTHAIYTDSDGNCYVDVIAKLSMKDLLRNAIAETSQEEPLTSYFNAFQEQASAAIEKRLQKKYDGEPLFPEATSEVYYADPAAGRLIYKINGVDLSGLSRIGGPDGSEGEKAAELYDALQGNNNCGYLATRALQKLLSSLPLNDLKFTVAVANQALGTTETYYGIPRPCCELF